MLYNARGDYFCRNWGRRKEFEWAPRVDGESLPAWLTLRGTSAIQTVQGIDGDRGFARFQTKLATPTAGDSAGVQTAQNIDTAEFEEIALIVYGVATDSNTATDHNLILELSDGAGGAFVFNNATSAGVTQLRVRPGAAQTFTWEFALNNNGTRRKDIGLIIRPPTREVFVTVGDPAEGAGVVMYDAGTWVDVTANPFFVAVFTQTAAQRYMEFDRIKFRVVPR